MLLNLTHWSFKARWPWDWTEPGLCSGLTGFHILAGHGLEMQPWLPLGCGSSLAMTGNRVCYCTRWQKFLAPLCGNQSHGRVCTSLRMSALLGACCRCTDELWVISPSQQGQLWPRSAGSPAVGVRKRCLISGWVNRQLLVNKASSCLHICW